MMRLNIFEKSENLGPTILIKYRKITETPGIFKFYSKFHFSKNFKISFRNKELYLSYLNK